MQLSMGLNLSLADKLGIGIFRYSLSPEERFIATNSCLLRILGYSSEKKFKKIKFDSLFLNANDKEDFFRILREERKIRCYETVFRNKNGKTFWVAIGASWVVVRDKKEYLEGIIEDISLHKEKEQKVLLERDFLQGLLDNIPDAVYFKDRQNRIIKVNKFYAQGAGLKAEEIVGKTDFDFFPAEQAKKMLEDDNDVLKTGKPIIGKIERTLLRNGSWNQVITTKIPMYDRKGKIIGTMGITRDMTAYANLEKERFAMLMNGLAVLGRALEMRDPYTAIHTRNVANIAKKIARALGWEEGRILEIELAGELHDLGKISIPLDILNKSGKLNELEYRLIQGHVKNCYDLIKDVSFPFPLADIVSQHHERLDGSGYPGGLKEDKILMEARILAVSDVLESMTSYRPYREALGLKSAIEELKGNGGLKFDSKVVNAALELIKENKGRAFWLDN